MQTRYLYADSQRMKTCLFKPGPEEIPDLTIELVT